MTRDIKAITEAYNLSINNTTRDSASYSYPPKEEYMIRGEQEEGNSLKKIVATELDNLAKKAARGLPEDYRYIVSSLRKLQTEISTLI